MSTYQKALDDIKELREELLNDNPTMSTEVRRMFGMIFEILNVLAARGMALEDWNHQAWVRSDELQARLKDPR